ncbi:PIG-L deacetylase family protein [Telmatospirillum sp. J64-1]|uniref:PIG-L deacetylase family protein n=1 Tax=Telmatospirillum sp. J64-1 TaxID=2502183 RepID=UPI001C8F9B07|nr:PIG-L deacetylase family protein [Telmatospirillum sp. J64-1]
MMGLHFGSNGTGPKRVLCLGAHCDDIEIGCGGTILRLVEERPEIEIRWIVFSGAGTLREEEARKSAAEFLHALPTKTVEVKGFRNAFFPDQWAEIKQEFERIRKEFEPDLIFTHYRCDHHQDHRVVSELTWNTFRNHLVLEYEIAKYDGDLGNPNLFAPLDRDKAKHKVDALMRHFESQHKREWFTEDTFHAMLRLRGIHANAPSGLAEAFHCRKMVI